MHAGTDGTSTAIPAVILAAGCSRRMGAEKLLLPLRGRPILTHVIDSLSAAGVAPIIIVTGHAADGIERAVAEYDVQLVHNPDYEQGEMLSSVKAGLAALPRCDALLLVLGDQPEISSCTVERLVRAWRSSRPRVIVPTFDGRRGHPICLAADGIAEILSLSSDQTLKTYVARHADEVFEVPVDDPAVIADVDTPQQYRRLIETGVQHVQANRR